VDNESLYQRLLNHFGGSQKAAADALGVDPQVVSNWKSRGFPPARALDIEAATKGNIPARDVLAARDRAA
jgi:DNA-binding transcriptional regulator YdaS (Cro superfamily)